MQSVFIVKADELLDPSEYPESQQKLIGDLNKRINLCMGVITGLGKEYHTIWLVDCKDLSMRLYRSTGENTARGAIDLVQRFNNYDSAITEYIDTYVADRADNVLHDVRSEVVLENIRDGEMYTVDYMRIGDDSTISYHQMAFVLAGDPGEAEYFILAFRDIDSSMRKHISDKLYLREQLDIVAALSRDYYNIFKIDINTGQVMILKLDGYVTKGMDKPGDKKYPYDVLCRQYITDRVYSEDQAAMFKAMSFETVCARVRENKEYVSSYRVLDKGEIHYYQFTYLPLNPENLNSGILAAYKNVDDIVQSAREREALAVLAETDIMTGILNRGSGERKVKDALANGRSGMLCIIDVDDFKHINDNYGHDVGDMVIRGIAEVISGEFRERDIVFRLGGDEYAVFAFGINEEEPGRAMIERIFSRISKLDIPELEGHHVSVSAGASLTGIETRPDFEELYKQADAGVYRCKEVDGCAVAFYGLELYH
ncbi:MAG: GGDEF domain-containing protein [Lachnospiraceae bacterium]|nr:GGDEF domain-containing protein [Lachnospiraceae bacterium]